jgi:hypothetical protein
VAEKYGDPMRFYDEAISEDRKKELSQWVSLKRKVNPLSELKNKYKDLDKMNDEFNRVFGEWMSENPQWEHARLRSHEKRKEIDVMLEYLMKQEYDREETAKVKDIILWSQLTEATSMTAADIERVRNTPEYVTQAKQVCNNISAIVNITRLQLQLVQKG